MNGITQRNVTTGLDYQAIQRFQATKSASTKHSARVDFQDSHGKNYKSFGDSTLNAVTGFQKGFGIDLDGDGKFNLNKDGLLSLNLGGKNGVENVTRTNDLLKAFGGNFDANGDGKLSSQELHRGNRYAQQGAQMDLDRDGTLSRFELQAAGAKVVKHNGGPSGFFGGFGSAFETQQVSLPGFETPKPSYHPPSQPTYGRPAFGAPLQSPFFGSMMHNIFQVFSGFGSFGGFGGFAGLGGYGQPGVSPTGGMLQGPTSLGIYPPSHG